MRWGLRGRESIAELRRPRSINLYFILYLQRFHALARPRHIDSNQPVQHNLTPSFTQAAHVMATTLPKGGVPAASTYTFSSQPRAVVPARSKFRNPECVLYFLA